MYFTNLTTQVFLKFKSMSKECYYSVSADGRCWKFIFDNNYGIALVKHSTFTENDMWSTVAICVENHYYYPIDDIRLNNPIKKIFEYAELIKGGFFQ